MTIIAVGEHIVIDNQKRQVFVLGEQIELPERSYRLLLTLVENAPNIVSHDQLIKAVWDKTVVSDEALKQRISRLRKQLASKDSRINNYFVAERGLGYRCSVPTKVDKSESHNNESNPNHEEPISSNKDSSHNSQSIQHPSVNSQFEHTSSEQYKVTPSLEITTKQTTLSISPRYLWLLPLFAFIIVLVFFNQRENSTNPNTTKNESPTKQTAIAPDLTPRDFEKQAQQYYYRFNSAANDTAIGLYRQAINIDPNYALGYFGLGNSYAQGYYQYGKPYQWLSQSLQYSKQAIEISPEQTWGYKSLGLGLYLDGQYTKAIENYQHASKLASWWASPVNNIALAQMEIGELTTAYHNAIKAVELGPKDPIPYLFLGLIYRDLGMSGHATKAIGRAINFMPDYNLAISYQAEFLLINGQYQHAINAANKALTTNFDNQLAYWVLAHAWLAQANTPNAIEALQKAANLGGRYSPIVLSYLAILNHQPLGHHEQLLQAKIEQGNQWFEYPLALAAIKAANNDAEQSLYLIQQAIDSGLNHPTRFKMTPFFKGLTQDSKTNTSLLALISKLEEKIAKQRQKVIQIEQSRDF